MPWMDFMNFHGWTSIQLGCLQIHFIHKNGSKENKKFEVKTFQFALNMFQNNLVSSLNFECAPLNLQIPVKFFFLKK
jgi:hypothetical protein